MYKLLLVGIGGFVGACMRYLMDETVYLFISKEAFPPVPLWLTWWDVF
ncbi:MAG: hypothetical protein U5K69_11975 [Balneolaceae bacterium]|nr:hypothetical protein [Balneolaceae bacterium]